MACLQRLAGLPGGLVLDRESVLRTALAELPWRERLAEDQPATRQEAEGLRRQLDTWRLALGPERRRMAPSLSAGLRRLAQRLRYLATVAGSPPAEQRADADIDALQQAADRLDAAALGVATRRRRSDDAAAAALDETLAVTGGRR